MRRQKIRLIMMAGVTFCSQEIAYADCDSARTTIEINECLSTQFDEIDANLNETYKHVLQQLSKPDVPGMVNYKEAKQDLIQAQRAWIIVRDKDCSAVYALSVGGSMRNQLYLGCKQRRTEQRIKELQELIEP